jgi:apolipoprotein N-acyltransferase
MINQILLLKTILSALLFSIAFFSIDNFGFLIIPSILLMLWILRAKVSIKLLLIVCTIWGFIVFGLHFIWLFILLLTKSRAGWLLALFLHLIVTTYFTCVAAFWVFATDVTNKLFFKSYKTCRLIFSTVSVFGLFLFLDKASLFWFFGCCKGYPFINPLIPLANSKILTTFFFYCINLLFPPGPTNQPLLTNMYEVVWIKPHFTSAGYHEINPNKIRLSVFHQILNYRSSQGFQSARGNKPVLFVAPESMYPAALNKEPETLKLWAEAMPVDSHFLLGTQVEQKDGKLQQVVAWIKEGRINKFYVKKLLMPIIETTQTPLYQIQLIRDLFSQIPLLFSPTPDPISSNFFDFPNNFTILPQICSEFFFGKALNVVANQNKPTIILFINDSWFVKYFRKIMFNSALLKIKSIAASVRTPVLFVGHNESFFFAREPPT